MSTNQSSATQQAALNQLFVSHGWHDPTDYYVLSPVSNPCGIPSPFSVTEDQEVGDHVERQTIGQSMSIWRLFNGFSQSDSLKYTLRNTPLRNNGEFIPYMGALRRGFQPVLRRSSLSETATTWPLLLDPYIAPDLSKKPWEPDPSARRSLHVRRLTDQATGDLGYFLIHTNLRDVRVNNESFLPNTVVGPLPSFAIIEIGTIAMFWWRDKAAVDYIPVSNKRKSLGVSDFVESTGPAAKRTKGAISKKQTVTDSEKQSDTTWREILDKGMEAHRECKKENKTGFKNGYRFLQLKDIIGLKKQGLFTDEVRVAIASVWAALRKTDDRFAFADKGFYDDPAELEYLTEKRIEIVGVPKPLIFPVLLEHPDSGKSMAHLYLCVAHLIDGTDSTVRLEIHDSLEGYIPRASLENKCKEMIRGSKWPFDQTDASTEHQLTWVETDWPTVPSQQRQINTCGFYVILNAWASLLGIPVEPNAKRRIRGRDENAFLAAAFDIINLAMQGCMNTRTIQAFLNVWGYCEGQDCNDPEKLVKNVDTENMGHDLLDDTIMLLSTTKPPTPSKAMINAVRDHLLLGTATDSQVEDALFSQGFSLVNARNSLLNQMIKSPTPPAPATVQQQPPVDGASRLKSPETTQMPPTQPITGVVVIPDTAAVVPFKTISSPRDSPKDAGLAGESPKKGAKAASVSQGSRKNEKGKLLCAAKKANGDDCGNPTTKASQSCHIKTHKQQVKSMKMV